MGGESDENWKAEDHLAQSAQRALMEIRHQMTPTESMYPLR
jgi:hypothetical protein